MKENSSNSSSEEDEKTKEYINKEIKEKKKQKNIKQDEDKNIESKNIINRKKERISLEELLNEELDLSDDMNKGRTGLYNIGNTCFMNSGLQCLSNCYQLTKYFLLDLYENDINEENKLGSGGKIAFTYRKLLEDLWKGEENAINPSYFKNIFAQFVRKFSGYAQQDSNEFLIYLLDKIHEDLNSISKKPYIEIDEKGKDETDEDASKRWWKMHLLRENSIIVDLFQGQFKSTITCNYCNRIAVSFDSYMFLSLPIPSGKYEINIKYFGYEIDNYFDLKIPITENTTVLNIIDIIEKKLSNKKSANKTIGSPPSKSTRRKNNKKKRNKYYQQKTEEILSGDYSVEMVLLTKYKNIYKVFHCNDYIFPYLQQGYELVAYEKKNKSENIYFYLTKYNNSYFYSYFYPKFFLFDYPLVIDIEKKEKIFSLYGKISIYLNKLISDNKKI